MTVEEIRKSFPILSEKVYGKPLVYFDNAATSQRPSSVIGKYLEMSRLHNANIHRSVHFLANEATKEFEAARDAVASFINAPSREEVIFTSGTTASINLVAYSFGEAFIGEGDEVVIYEAEHHSNIVPWQLMCQRKKAVIKPLRIEKSGEVSIEALENLLSERTKIVAISHISNILGVINPVKEIVSVCHKKGIPVLIDGAQGVVHQKVDVQEMDCDFYCFSGHKIYAATGTGVLYGKKKFLEAMPPYMGGGEMIDRVSFEKTTYASLPYKFEAGTQNIASVPTFVPALEFAKAVREDKATARYQEAVKEYLYEILSGDDRITLYGVPRRTEDKIPLFSFTVEGVHHEDLALILDKMGIAVRSGQMCAEPTMDRFGVTGMLRASLAPYNTMEEAEYFIKSLDRAINMLR
jgi:cysteine desulfurase/selenocysteine lyase